MDSLGLEAIMNLPRNKEFAQLEFKKVNFNNI